MRESVGSLLILTGPPGAGKSTVARLLAEQTEPGVHLHTDDFWHFIRSGWIAPYLAAAHSQNQVVMRVLAAAAVGYVTGGYHVIVDGIIGPWFVDVFQAAARANGIPVHYVVLLPDRASTLRRATGRGAGALTDPGPLNDLYDQFADLDRYAAHALDSTAQDAPETAGVVRQVIAAGTHLLPP